MKRHLITAGGGLLGIFLTVALLESGASVIQGRQSAATPEFTLETPDLADVPDLGGDGTDAGEADIGAGDMGAGDMGPGEAVPGDPAENSVTGSDTKPVRGIAPEQFGMQEEIPVQPLQRIEARQPLSEPVARPEPVPVVLRHPVALAAGLIQFDNGRLLQLDGLVAQTVERTCDDGGRTWPCGNVARTAFRNFLRARALVCTVPKGGWQGTLTAGCTVANIDPANWLAENGWAEAMAGSPLEDKVEAAKRAGLGFYGKDPRTVSATPVPQNEAAVPAAAETGTETPGPNL